MLHRLKLEAASRKGSIASANSIQSPPSSPHDSGRLSKSTRSGRTSLSNGSGVSISSTSSRRICRHCHEVVIKFSSSIKPKRAHWTFI
ncbi:hypothetical protein Mapa_004887 [Marchantia paleacea]|nr:hypothetical protein Mapa_004887 [Marchantia paleacea]